MIAMPPTPTAQERDAFLWMQGRMVELLLRHDVQRFDRTFGEQIADQLRHPLLTHYRNLAVVFFLRDELFGSIVPRIKRRLSFAAPRELMTEELPPRGRIDWSRTITDGLRDRPGEMPLDVQTRQRRRHFATPENLLAVATLLEYRAFVEQLLDQESAADSIRAVRHPLHDIAETCTRELAFLQFAGLVPQARAIIAGEHSSTVAALEQQVADNLLPGRNSAYDDLLAWRGMLGRLDLLDRTTAPEASAMLGADPARDNYLYQLWLFYELGDLLQRVRRLTAWHVGDMELQFSWGADGDQLAYTVRHDQAIPQHWSNAPGVRPDLYIAKVDREEIRDGTQMLWHEPGYVLDAKYYKPRDSDRAPSSPLKRMIADLQLAGESNGALLFAFQQARANQDSAGDDSESLDVARMAQTRSPLYEVAPNAATSYAASSVAQISIWRVQPALHADTRMTEATLTALLGHVHATLRRHVAIVCHGFLPDGDTVNPSHTAPARCTRCRELLAFCPKPHVSDHHIDRVCPRCDCLRSRRLCHIIGRGEWIAPPFVKRVLSREDLLASVQQLRGWLREHVAPDDQSEQAEQARQQMLHMIGELTENYVKLTRADTTQTAHMLREYIFETYWDDAGNARHLPEVVRQMLISGEYVWMQLRQSTVEDWAACAVQYTRALEHELQRRFYEPCGTRLLNRDGLPMQPKHFTIGTLAPLYYNRKSSPNWQTLLACVAQPSGVAETTLKQLVLGVEAIRLDRNKVAHTDHVDVALATKIRAAVLGKPGHPGLLHRVCTQLAVPATYI